MVTPLRSPRMMAEPGVLPAEAGPTPKRFPTPTPADKGSVPGAWSSLPGVYVKWKLDPCGALGVKRGCTADPGADTPLRVLRGGVRLAWCRPRTRPAEAERGVAVVVVTRMRRR